MAIRKDFLITAQDNIDRAESQAVVIKVQEHIEGGFFDGTTSNFETHFWTRGKCSTFQYPQWLAGTTYAKDEKVHNGTSTWKSKADGNIGHSPNTDYWVKLWTQSMYPNERVYSSDLGVNNLNGNFQRWTNGSSVMNRADEVLFTYSAYNAGTTYGFKAIVFDAATDAYYVSAVAGNLGNDLDDETFWFVLIENNDYPAWHNFKFAISAKNIKNNVWNVFAERIIWDDVGSPHYIPVYSLAYVNNSQNSTPEAFLSLEPGYYRFKGTHSAGAFYGDSYIYGYSRQAVSTMVQEDQINTMNAEFSDNVVDKITATLGVAGRLSHPDFKGGTAP